MRNGSSVAAFEKEFAQYVGAKYAIALCNGTATLHTAMAALGVRPGDRVAVPPLTMSATTIAVLHAGAVPVFRDVDRDTWLMAYLSPFSPFAVPVSLFGLHFAGRARGGSAVDDAAQTLRPHGGASFTSYSFQASKILALGEGGMLVTNDEALAQAAREFSSLGYRMRADQPRIDPAALKEPTYERHHTLGWNYRMNDITAGEGRLLLELAPHLLAQRRDAAAHYAFAVEGCEWLTPQYVPDGWVHDWWTYAVACDTPERARLLQEAVVRHGGECPYGAWRLTYHEPAFRHLGGYCPVAESLQPRLLQFQTNGPLRAERNAGALVKAIADVG